MAIRLGNKEYPIGTAFAEIQLIDDPNNPWVRVTNLNLLRDIVLNPAMRGTKLYVSVPGDHGGPEDSEIIRAWMTMIKPLFPYSYVTSFFEL